jgi:multidrug resistance efflux pump
MRYGNANRKLTFGRAGEPDRDEAPPADQRGARGLRRMLEEQFGKAPEPRPENPQETAEPAPAAPQMVAAPQQSAAGSRLAIRSVKIALGLAIVAIFGWMPLRTLLQPTSVEAIVNSRIVTVRSPIDGQVSYTSASLSGSRVIAGDEALLRVQNTRADRTRLDSLRDRLARLHIEQPAIEGRIAAAEAALEELTQDLALFTAARIRQLEARSAGLQSDIAAAEARREVAVAAAERALALSRSGNIASADLQRLDLERTVADQSVISAERQLDAVIVELDALRRGRFVGDGYNDRPSSAEERDEIRRRLDELRTALTATKAEIAQIEQSVVDETARYRDLSDVTVSLPVSGRIWEVLTAPGEQVRVGQELLKILDCSAALVTANVTESVYNRLRVGAPARFHPTDGGDMQGTVVNLTGLAAAPANFAILPSALNRGGYRVTVEVPALATDGSCAVGRTGRVVFGKATAGS